MVVAVGLTVRVPDAATVPIPWLIDTVVAPELFQVSVEEAPLEAGLADVETDE